MNPNKKSKFKSLFNQSVFYGIGNAIQSFAGFLFLPLFTKYYSTEEFGIYSLILTISSIANAIFFLGASSALTRYYYEEDSIKHQKSVVTNSFILGLIGSILLLLFGLGFSSYFSFLISGNLKFESHILLIIFSTAFNILINFNLVVLRLDEKKTHYLFCSLGVFFVNIIILYLTLIIFGLKIFAPLVSAFVANFVFFIASVYFVRTKIDFKLFNREYLIQYFKFGIIIIGIGILFSILDSEDRFILKGFSSLKDVGIYSFGLRLSSIINVFFILPAGLVWSVYRMQFYKDPTFNDLTAKIFTYFFNVGLAIIFFSELFIYHIASIFNINSNYIDSFKLMPVLMLAVLLYGCTTYLEFGLIIKNKLYYYLFFYCLGLVFFWMISNMLVPYFGVTGIAYSKVIVFALILFVLARFSTNFYDVPIQKKKIFIPVIFIFLSFVLVDKISGFHIIYKIIFFLVYLVLNFVFIVSPGDKMKLKRQFN